MPTLISVWSSFQFLLCGAEAMSPTQNPKVRTAFPVSSRSPASIQRHEKAVSAIIDLSKYLYKIRASAIAAATEQPTVDFDFVAKSLSVVGHYLHKNGPNQKFDRPLQALMVVTEGRSGSGMLVGHDGRSSSYLESHPAIVTLAEIKNMPENKIDKHFANKVLQVMKRKADQSEIRVVAFKVLWDQLGRYRFRQGQDLD
eukprot:gene304-906_t